MCGIAGCAWTDPRTAPDISLADAMVDALEHRGPDDRGVWTGPGGFVGARRLSIIDVEGGHQPISNPAGRLHIAYNGELYNFSELRDELHGRGHRFRTATDTEVVLLAFEEWGADCLKRFNGMFAFAVWDSEDRTMFVARDRIGEKPLYYHVDGERVVFASEIKALLKDPSVPREPGFRGIADFLAYGHAHAPDTAFADVHKLPPAHFMTIRAGRVEIQRYWDVLDASCAQPVAGAEAEEQIRALLQDSVSRRMVADVPLGAFLSGGVDSSAVVAMMCRTATEPVKTFSLGFEGGGHYDETSDARWVSEFLGTDHHEIRVTAEASAEALQKLAVIYDEPFGDAAGYPLYLLSKAASEQVKVVLTGEGGDELFGGYRRYVVDRFASRYQLLPRLVTESLAPGLVGLLPRRRRLKRLVRTIPIRDGGRRNATWLRFFDDEAIRSVLADDFVESAAAHDPSGAFETPYKRFMDRCNDGTNALMYVDVSTWLHDTFMEKVDKVTMAVGLEARQPILDHRLVELAFNIPGSEKVRGLSTKRIFKKALEPLVPQRVLQKRKHGFAVPTDSWFSGALREFVREVLLDGRTASRGILDTTAVESVLLEHASGRQEYDQQIWLLLMLELWAREYLDGEAHD